MKMILNLEYIRDISSIKEGQKLSVAFIDNEGMRSSEFLGTIILDDNYKELGYVTYNGNYVEWDFIDTRPHFGNPYKDKTPVGGYYMKNKKMIIKNNNSRGFIMAEQYLKEYTKKTKNHII